MIDQRGDGIYGFFEEARFLSNFWMAPCEYEGILYPSSEYAYQAAKTFDLDVRRNISQLTTAGQAKRAGQAAKMREDWPEVKRTVMKDILRDKFTRNDNLKQMLLDTDQLYLEETNHWGDTYWGVCKGSGQNNLGHVLMEIREELNEQERF